MSRSGKVKMYRVFMAGSPRETTSPSGFPGLHGSVVLVVIQPGQPGGQPLDGRLELRVEVDELAEPLRHPGEGDLLGATPLCKLLDAPISEVHVFSLSEEETAVIPYFMST